MSLHILSGSNSLSRCQSSLQPGDSIVLIEDAVSLLRLENTSLASYSLHALTDDVNRRGVASKQDFQEIDYAGFVALCAAHRHILNW